MVRTIAKAKCRTTINAKPTVAATAYQFAPRNPQIALYALSEKMSAKFIHMWNVRNRTSMQPEMLINIFLPIEEVKILPLIIFLIRLKN